MYALWRINLLVTLFFVLLASVCLAVLLRQAGYDVQREMNAASSVVEYLTEMVDNDPALLHPGLTDSLRHVRVRWLPGDEPIADVEKPVVDWLGAWLYPPELAPTAERSLADGRRIRISVDPHDEVEEVRDSLMQLLVMFAMALLLSLLAIRWAVRPGARVLADLLSALVRIAEGKFDTRLRPHRLPEARQLTARFNQMAAALEQARSDNDQLTQTLIALQERERTQLAQALHDDLGQYVAGIRARACLLKVQAQSPEAVRDTAAHLEKHSQDLQSGFQMLVRDLYPVMLDHLPLERAIEQLVGQWQEAMGIECHLNVLGPMPELTTESKLHLYRLVQEALTNVARHSEASRVSLQMDADSDSFRLQVNDNGHGRPPARAGVGLRSMGERARCLGAQLRFAHRPGIGWTLYLTMPAAGVP